MEEHPKEVVEAIMQQTNVRSCSYDSERVITVLCSTELNGKV